MRVTNDMRQGAGAEDPVAAGRVPRADQAGGMGDWTLKSTGWSDDSSITSEELYVR